MNSIIRNINSLKIPLHLSRNYTLASLTERHSQRTNQNKVIHVQNFPKISPIKYSEPSCSYFTKKNDTKSLSFAENKSCLPKTAIKLTYTADFRLRRTFSRKFSKKNKSDVSRLRQADYEKEKQRRDDICDDGCVYKIEERIKKKKEKPKKEPWDIKSVVNINKILEEQNKENSIRAMHERNKIHNFIYKPINCKHCQKNHDDKRKREKFERISKLSQQKRSFCSYSVAKKMYPRYEVKKRKFQRNYERSIIPEESKEVYCPYFIKDNKLAIKNEDSDTMNKIQTEEKKAAVPLYLIVKEISEKSRSENILKNYKGYANSGNVPTRSMSETNIYSIGKQECRSSKSNIDLISKKKEEEPDGLMGTQVSQNQNENLKEKSERINHNENFLVKPKASLGGKRITFYSLDSMEKRIEYPKQQEDSKDLAQTISRILRPVILQDYIKYKEVKVAIERLEKNLHKYFNQNRSIAPYETAITSKYCTNISRINDEQTNLNIFDKPEKVIRDPFSKLEINDPLISNQDKKDPNKNLNITAPSLKNDEFVDPTEYFVKIVKGGKKGGPSKRKPCKRREECKKKRSRSSCASAGEKVCIEDSDWVSHPKGKEDFYEKKDSDPFKKDPSKKHGPKKDPYCVKPSKKDCCKKKEKKCDDPCKKDPCKKQGSCKMSDASKKSSCRAASPCKKKEDTCKKKEAVCRMSDSPKKIPRRAASPCKKKEKKQEAVCKISDPCDKPKPCPIPMRASEVICKIQEHTKKRGCEQAKVCHEATPRIIEVKCPGPAVKPEPPQTKCKTSDCCKSLPMPEDCPMKIREVPSVPKVKPVISVQRSCSQKSMEPTEPPNCCKPRPKRKEGICCCPSELRNNREEPVKIGRPKKQKPCRTAKKAMCQLKPQKPPPKLPPCPKEKPRRIQCKKPSKQDLRHCSKIPVKTIIKKPKKTCTINLSNVSIPTTQPCSNKPRPKPALRPQLPQQYPKDCWVPVKIKAEKSKSQACASMDSRARPPQLPTIKLDTPLPKVPVQKKGFLDGCKGLFSSFCEVFCPGKKGSKRKGAAGVAKSQSMPELMRVNEDFLCLSSSGDNGRTKPKEEEMVLDFERNFVHNFRNKYPWNQLHKAKPERNDKQVEVENADGNDISTSSNVTLIVVDTSRPWSPMNEKEYKFEIETVPHAKKIKREKPTRLTVRLVDHKGLWQKWHKNKNKQNTKRYVNDVKTSDGAKAGKEQNDEEFLYKPETKNSKELSSVGPCVRDSNPLDKATNGSLEEGSKECWSSDKTSSQEKKDPEPILCFDIQSCPPIKEKEGSPKNSSIESFFPNSIKQEKASKEHGDVTENEVSATKGFLDDKEEAFLPRTKKQLKIFQSYLTGEYENYQNKTCKINVDPFKPTPKENTNSNVEDVKKICNEASTEKLAEKEQQYRQISTMCTDAKKAGKSAKNAYKKKSKNKTFTCRLNSGKKKIVKPKRFGERDQSLMKQCMKMCGKHACKPKEYPLTEEKLKQIDFCSGKNVLKCNVKNLGTCEMLECEPYQYKSLSELNKVKEEEPKGDIDRVLKCKVYTNDNNKEVLICKRDLQKQFNKGALKRTKLKKPTVKVSKKLVCRKHYGRNAANLNVCHKEMVCDIVEVHEILKGDEQIFDCPRCRYLNKRASRPYTYKDLLKRSEEVRKEAEEKLSKNSEKKEEKH